MADIDPAPSWAPIRQLETTDRNLAGPGGVLNTQPTSIAARLNLLRDNATALNNTVSGVSSRQDSADSAIASLESQVLDAPGTLSDLDHGAPISVTGDQFPDVLSLDNSRGPVLALNESIADLAQRDEYLLAAVTESSELVNEKIAPLPSVLETLSSWVVPSITRQPGYAINKDTGVVTASANFWYAWAPLSGNEVHIRVTASLSQPFQALAVYKDAAGNYLGYEVAGPASETLYTDYVLQNVPPLARSVHVSSRRDNIAIGTRNLQSDIAATVTSSEVAVVSMQASLAPVKQTVSDWTPQTMTSVTGAYVDKTTGAQVTSSAYNYKYMSLSGAEGTLQFTTYVTGTTTVPVIFYNAAGGVIGTFGNVSTQYSNQAIPVPALARKVAVTARDGNPIDVKLQVVAPEIAKRLAAVEVRAAPSRWTGVLSASFGDSLVGQNRWQPLVAAVHGNVDTNCGVGGSKIAKPDASPTVVSMCDDTRVNAIPSASQLVLFEGGTNDWAQSVPLGSFDSSSDTEFYGALHVTFAKLLSRFPSSRIFCITSPYGERITVPGGWANGWTNAQGLTIRDYADAMREVAEFYAVPVIDWSRECGWSHSNVATYLDNDGAYFHPSVATGAPQLAQIVIGRLWDIQKRN